MTGQSVYRPRPRLQLQLQLQLRLLEQQVPVLLRPLIRAYILGYASSTVPRLLTLLLTWFSKRKKISGDGPPLRSSIIKTLLGGLGWHRFPAFCAALVGGSTLLQIPLSELLARFASSWSASTRIRLTRWLSTFIAAWFSIQLLQSRGNVKFVAKASTKKDTSNDRIPLTTRFAGRTMDLTLFAVTRAIDIVVGELWTRRKKRRMAAQQWTKAEVFISSITDPGIFATASGLIMWCWIYLPERLPRAYNKWIAGMAEVDSRLVVALNRCRWGDLVYGQDTGQAPLLQSMCRDYHWPEVWGDPAKSVPFPCEIVHMGTGKSCEIHASRRFIKGFLLAGGMYGPLNFALQLRNPSKEGLKRALISSIRSSAFLGSFIALFYYGVCLARTRIGPRVIGTDVQSRQMIDSGICIGSGCMLCGWSILLEIPGRQKDIALFVAPRALATLLPRSYEMKHQWRENVAFAMSTAVVFTCVFENTTRVRGVLGKVLGRVLVQ